MKLSDFAHCEEPTVKRAVIEADTVEIPMLAMPAYRPACQEYDVNRPCDGPQEYCFIDDQGRDVRVCADHARRSYQWPGRHQCVVHDIEHGRCQNAGVRIYHTLEDGDERLLCTFCYAFMQLLKAIDEHSVQAQQGGAA